MYKVQKCIINTRHEQDMYLYPLSFSHVLLQTLFLSIEKKNICVCVTLINHALFHNQVHWRKYVVIFYPYRSRKNKDIGGPLTTAHH